MSDDLRLRADLEGTPRIMEVWREGFDEGRAVGRVEIEVILADLIAELRGLNQNRDGGMWADDVHDLTDRAAQRLRLTHHNHGKDT